MPHSGSYHRALPDPLALARTPCLRNKRRRRAHWEAEVPSPLARPGHWAPRGCVLTLRVSVYSSDSKMANPLLARATAYLRLRTQIAECRLLPRRLQIPPNTAMCVAAKSGMTQWVKTNLQSLTYIRPPRTLSNLYGDFVQVRKEVVLNCSGLKACVLRSRRHLGGPIAARVYDFSTTNPETFVQ